jgi:hypothetical protein
MNFTIPISKAILDWITEHPYQTAFHVVNGVVLCTPAALTVPVFSALGFSSIGPVAGMPSLTLSLLIIVLNDMLLIESLHTFGYV